MFSEPFVSYKDRIIAGMAKLDAWRPDWYRHIDGNVLNIGSPTDCVCGQLSKLVPESVSGLRSWRKTLEAIDLPSTEAGEYGFVGTGFYDSYSELTREWRSAIKKRLAFDAEVAALSRDITTGNARTEEAVLTA